MNPVVSINIVVRNGEKYIRHCLDAILAQTYPHEHVEINILDNKSSDRTKETIKDSAQEFRNAGFSKFHLAESDENMGMWPGQDELLKHSSGKYILVMAVDVMLDKDFISKAVERMESDGNIGALEAKLYRYELSNNTIMPSNIIDTCGFKIFKSRRVINIGHGEEDHGQFNKYSEIFAVEGAAPFFRKEALDDSRVKGSLVDKEYFWYGDDLDLAWRMRLFGWKEGFDPNVVAWHDRQTTKSVKKSWSDYITRVPVRRRIPIKKRRLDWRNTRWTLVKNDYIINILKDLPWIVSREFAVLGYAVLFEPGVLKEIPTFFRYLPKMLRKRREIMKRVVVSPKEFRKWLT